MSTAKLISADFPTQTALTLQGLRKCFGETIALEDFSLQVAPGELVAITGPSGAGKSTLGRLISGLEILDGGDIELTGRAVSRLPPQRRRVAHMFESLALYPTLDVFNNVASPLRSPSHAGRVNPEDIRERVEEVLELTEILHLAERLPSELSGGQKQRVALCRALVQTPDLFILDEPIGHLDAKLRHKLRGDIRRRQHSLDQATLWLTPDAMEAMAVADRVVVLINGQIRQIGTPEEIYTRPVDTSVARLVGDPAMNLLEISVTGNGASMAAFWDESQIILEPRLMQRIQRMQTRRCILGFAPLRTVVDRKRVASDGHTGLAGEVYAVEPFGKFTLVTVELAGVQVKAKVAPDSALEVGTRVQVTLPQNQTLLFDADSGRLVPD